MSSSPNPPMASTKAGPAKTWIDRVAAAAALACAIECSVFPLVVAFLPMVGLGFLTHPQAEIMILGVVLVFSGFSMIRGRKKHGAQGPALLFGIAYIAIVLAHLVLENAVHPALETGAHSLAGISLAVASFWNWRLMQRSHGHCCDHHAHSKPFSHSQSHDVLPPNESRHDP